MGKRTLVHWTNDDNQNNNNNNYYVQMTKRLNESMNEWMNVCVSVCVHVCLYEEKSERAFFKMRRNVIESVRRWYYTQIRASISISRVVIVLCSLNRILYHLAYISNGWNGSRFQAISLFRARTDPFDIRRTYATYFEAHVFLCASTEYVCVCVFQL